MIYKNPIFKIYSQNKKKKVFLTIGLLKKLIQKYCFHIFNPGIRIPGGNGVKIKMDKEKFDSIYRKKIEYER